MESTAEGAGSGGFGEGNLLCDHGSVHTLVRCPRVAKSQHWSTGNNCEDMVKQKKLNIAALGEDIQRDNNISVVGRLAKYVLVL